MSTWTRVKTKDQFVSVVNSDALSVDCIIVDFGLASEDFLRKQVRLLKNESRKIYYQLPDVLRNPTAEKYLRFAKDFDGIVIKNLDELGMVVSAKNAEASASEETTGNEPGEGFFGKDFEIIGDAFLYAYNKPALELYRSFVPDMKFILSDELNKDELNQLRKNEPAADFILKVYGHQAVMITAQCLNKNYGRCSKQAGNKIQMNPVLPFMDENGENYICASNCRECYSVIYREEPTCIFSRAQEDYENLLFDFTMESGKETEAILKNPGAVVYNGGHYDKGIE